MPEVRSMKWLRLLRIQAYPVASPRHVAAELHVISGGDPRALHRQDYPLKGPENAV